MRLRHRIQLKIGQAMVHGLFVVERSLHGVSLNIFDPKLSEDPYSFYNRLRSKAPVHYSMALRVWWVTEFDLVQEVLRDKRFGADVRKFPERVKKLLPNLDADQRESFEHPSMLNLDPPDSVCSKSRRPVWQGVS